MTDTFPTQDELVRSGYTETEAKQITENPYAGLIFGCELPGERPQTYGDLKKF